VNGNTRSPAARLTVEDLALTATINAARGIRSGISAADQACTIRTAITAEDAHAVVIPGHVQPIRVDARGVRGRRAPSEAAVDLARLAGLAPAALVSEVLGDDMTAAAPAHARRLADRLGLVSVSVAELLAYCQAHEPAVERVVSTRLPTSFGDFIAVGYRSLVDDTEHIAMLKGDVRDVEHVLLHVHTRCVAGDAFHSLLCDCGAQLDAALRAIERAQRGVIIYRARVDHSVDVLPALAGHSARAASRTGASSTRLTFEPSEYEIVAAIINDLGPASTVLLTRHPREVTCLAQFGLRVGAGTLPVSVGA
jgi:3,4-dihydroxy 2-butanone 4-phosphate synthase/GTP cyclohydrolase II